VRIRFQADADLNHAVIAGLLRRIAIVDFRRAEAVPLEGLDDLLVLSAAAEEGRVLVSHDVNNGAALPIVHPRTKKPGPHPHSAKTH